MYENMCMKIYVYVYENMNSTLCTVKANTSRYNIDDEDYAESCELLF